MACESVSNVPSAQPSIKVQDAVTIAETALGGTLVSSIPPTVQYFVKDDGTLALTHVFHVSNTSTGAWYEAFVDAHSGKLVSVSDFVAHATVRAGLQLSQIKEAYR